MKIKVGTKVKLIPEKIPNPMFHFQFLKEGYKYDDEFTIIKIISPRYIKTTCVLCGSIHTLFSSDMIKPANQQKQLNLFEEEL